MNIDILPHAIVSTDPNPQPANSPWAHGDPAINLSTKIYWPGSQG